MGAIGNYEVVTEPFDLAAPQGQTVVVEVPSGKVALGWGSTNQLIDMNGNPTGLPNRDLIIVGVPASDGSGVTFAFSEAQSSGRTAGTLYVTCAEMGC